MAHEFPASLEFGCIREIVGLVRKGDLTLDEKLDVGQHIAHFWGSALEWYRVNGDKEDASLRGLIRLVLRQVLGVPVFGDEPEFNDISTETLCEMAESALPPEGFGDDAEAIPVIQILGILIPIVIEILKRMDILDEGADE